MTDNQQQGPITPEQASSIPPETLKSTMKAFKKRLNSLHSMRIRAWDAGPFRAGLRAFTRYNRQISFRARSGRDCAGWANSETAATIYELVKVES